MPKSPVWNIPQEQRMDGTIWWKGLFLHLKHFRYFHINTKFAKDCVRFRVHVSFGLFCICSETQISLCTDFFVDKGQPFILQCFVQVCVYTACVSVCVWESVSVFVCACVRAHHSALYRHGWDDLFHFICQLLLLGVLILLQCLNDLKHTGK